MSLKDVLIGFVIGDAMAADHMPDDNRHIVTLQKKTVEKIVISILIVPAVLLALIIAFGLLAIASIFI
jgi:hypothetical protein